MEKRLKVEESSDFWPAMMEEMTRDVLAMQRKHSFMQYLQYPKGLKKGKAPYLTEEYLLNVHERLETMPLDDLKRMVSDELRAMKKVRKELQDMKMREKGVLATGEAEQQVGGQGGIEEAEQKVGEQGPIINRWGCSSLEESADEPVANESVSVADPFQMKQMAEDLLRFANSMNDETLINASQVILQRMNQICASD